MHTVKVNVIMFLQVVYYAAITFLSKEIHLMLLLLTHYFQDLVSYFMTSGSAEFHSHTFTEEI